MPALGASSPFTQTAGISCDTGTPAPAATGERSSVRLLVRCEVAGPDCVCVIRQGHRRGATAPQRCPVVEPAGRSPVGRSGDQEA
jgi:hypothetical protein